MSVTEVRSGRRCELFRIGPIEIRPYGGINDYIRALMGPIKDSVASSIRKERIETAESGLLNTEAIESIRLPNRRQLLLTQRFGRLHLSAHDEEGRAFDDYVVEFRLPEEVDDIVEEIGLTDDPNSPLRKQITLTEVHFHQAAKMGATWLVFSTDPT